MLHTINEKLEINSDKTEKQHVCALYVRQCLEVQLTLHPNLSARESAAADARYMLLAIREVLRVLWSTTPARCWSVRVSQAAQLQVLALCAVS